MFKYFYIYLYIVYTLGPRLTRG